LAACVINPVTGDRELALISAEQEIAIGREQYAPSQQMQGGDYLLDAALTAYVAGVGQRLAAVSDRALPYEFVVLNNSVPNAWALPGGKIAINRGLLTELDSEAELAAVLGHEIVHAAARHSAQQVTRGMLSQVAVLATAIVASDQEYAQLAVGGAGLAAQLVNARYGREAELEADRYGMEYMSRSGYDPTGAVNLQETFVRLSEDRKSDWLSGLFASHPPSQERVEANREMAATLPAGGRSGEEQYRQRMQKTLERAPAYAAYDDGRRLLAEGDRVAALAKAEEALKLLPEEAHFHALRGDIRLLDDNYKDAVTNYSRAIERRPNFFYYHLQRGLAKKAQGDQGGAVTDLERSRAILPTAPAELALGEIAERRGNLDKAVEHYRVVAQSGGEYGTAARGALARLELPRNPGGYFRVGCGADSRGNLVVAVRNEAPVPVTGLVLAVDIVDNAGRTRRLTQELRGVLQSGEVAQANMGIGPWTGGSCPAGVIAARPVS
jgi:predicted Zn-dependent protease